MIDMKHSKKYSSHFFKLALVSCALMLFACGTQRENDTAVPGSAASLNIALNTAIANSIIPAVTGFNNELTTLQSRAAVFCTAKDATTLMAMQTQWRLLSEQWNRLSMYNIGPLSKDLTLFAPLINYIESMRERGIDYTSTVRSLVTDVISNTPTLNQAYFDALVSRRVGMLALEVLIFEDSMAVPSTSLTDIVTDYQTNTIKCDLLTGMVALMQRHAEIVVSGWQANFDNSGKSFTDILLDGELADAAESVPALIASIQLHLDYTKRRKLETALLDARIAGHFYANIRATLDEIEVLLEGADPDSFTFFDHMLAGGYGDQVEIVRNTITVAKTAAVNEDRVALITAIGELDGNFKREIPDGLNVVLGITFSDGD